MSRLFSLLIAAIAALTLGACANPWWDRNSGDEQTGTTQSGTMGDTSQGADSSAQGTGQSGDMQSGSDTQAGQDPSMSGQQDEEFAQAIEKCQSLSGTAYQDCVDQARRDAGQM